MVPTGCWIGAGLGPEADQLEGGSTAVLAGMRPCDTVRSQMAIASGCKSRATSLLKVSPTGLQNQIV